MPVKLTTLWTIAMVGAVMMSWFDYSVAGSAFRVKRNVAAIAGGAPGMPRYVGAKRAIAEGLPRFARAPQEEGTGCGSGNPPCDGEEVKVNLKAGKGGKPAVKASVALPKIIELSV